MKYLVTWSIDIEDAKDHVHAAQLAMAHMRRADSTATVFDVQAEGQLGCTTVDLDEIHSLEMAQGQAEAEEPMRFINFYECPRCGEEWDEIWSCTCDSECSECGARNISPTHSEDLDEEDEEESANG